LYTGIELAAASTFLHRFLTIWIRGSLNKAFKSKWPQKELIIKLAIGFVTATVVGVLTDPFEVIKRKMIVGSTNDQNPLITVQEYVKNTYENEGFLGFFRGFTVNLIKGAMAAGVILLLEHLVKFEIKELRDAFYKVVESGKELKKATLIL